jgi:hypothetical protein
VKNPLRNQRVLSFLGSNKNLSSQVPDGQSKAPPSIEEYYQGERTEEFAQPSGQLTWRLTLKNTLKALMRDYP